MITYEHITTPGTFRDFALGIAQLREWKRGRAARDERRKAEQRERDNRAILAWAYARGKAKEAAK